MEQLKTNWESIGLSNDFLFGKIMRKPALCKRMLEIILGVKIDRLEYLESQKSIDEEWDARSIRLDIYVQDNREVAYNIEIQTTNTGDLPQTEPLLPVCAGYAAAEQRGAVQKSEADLYYLHLYL